MKKLFTSLILILFVVVLNAQYTNSYTYPFFIGKVGTSTGSITLKGTTSGTVQITVPDVAGTGTIFKLPASNGTSGYVLRTDGSGILSWIPLTGYATLASPTFTGTVTIPTPFTLGAVSVTSTGTQLNYLSGATGTTGTGSVVLSAAPTITGHPVIEGVTSTGATGTGNLVFSTSPVFTTPNIGTATGSITGNAATVTTNANLTGVVTSVGNATSFAASPPFTGTMTAVNISATGGIQGQGEFNVIQYGAINNDGLEDNTAIQAAVTAATAWSATHNYMGATVRVPPGYWYITAGIELASHIHIKCDHGALFYFPGSYAGNMWQMTAGNSLEFASVEGGHYGIYASTQTWDLIDIASNDDLKFMTGCRFSNMFCQSVHTAIRLTVTNDGWINNNNFSDFIIWRPIYGINMSQAGTGLGMENNVFSAVQIQCDSPNTIACVNLVNAARNTFIGVMVADFTLPSLAASVDATSHYNHFYGCNLGDRGTNFIENSNTSWYMYQETLTNDLDLIKWGSVLSWYNGDVALTHSGDLLTLSGGDLALGANDLTMTGSLAATANRVTKGWFTDLEVTNDPTINGTSLLTNITSTASDVVADTMTAYRASAIPLETVTIMGKTIVKTIGVVGEVGVDYNFVTAANHTAQNIEFNEVVPAKSDVLRVVIVCTEACVNGDGAVDILFRAGNASAGEQFIPTSGAGLCDDLNENIKSTMAATDAVGMNWASATDVFIQGDPDQEWDTMTAGRWAVYITYQDYTDI